MNGNKIKLALIGTNGIPASYGGAETFYENLTRQIANDYDITVYCSKKQPREIVGDSYLGAKLKYLPLSANGWQSFPYDCWSLIHAARHSDVILLFGVTGCGVLLWLMRVLGFKKTVILNHGGLDEWKRESYPFIARKLGFFSRWLLRDKVIHVADNNLLSESLKNSFGIENVSVIRYGGDQAITVNPEPNLLKKYPFLCEQYFVAVARAQVDNNLHILLEAFAKIPSYKLVLVSNFKVSEYGQKLYEQYRDKYPNMILIPGIYDKKELNAVRSNALAYIHSHSRCGTPPSLCEAMCLGLPIISFDCEVNHEVTDDNAYFFNTPEDLIEVIEKHSSKDYEEIGKKSYKWAMENLTWARIGSQYSQLFDESKDDTIVEIRGGNRLIVK